MGERFPVCKKVVRDDLTGVDFNFTNGHVIAVNLSDFEKYRGGPDGSDDILLRATIHGLSQKVGDDFSGVKGDVELAIGKSEAVLERLLAGEWNIPDKIGPSRALVVEAVIRSARAQGVVFKDEDVRAKYMARTEAAKTLVDSALANQAVKAMIDTIKEEKAAERAAASRAKAAADGASATALSSLV